MEKIKALFKSCVSYLKANPILGYILVGVAALIVLVIFIAICKKIIEKASPPWYNKEK